MKKYLSLVMLVIPLVLVFGCSGYGSPAATSPASSPSVAGSQVNIANFSFSPATITVKVGTTVTWTNNDGTTHTVTSNSGLFNQTLAPGATFSNTFNQTGTFQYRCNIHSSMTGNVIVTN